MNNLQYEKLCGLSANFGLSFVDDILLARLFEELALNLAVLTLRQVRKPTWICLLG